MILSLTLILLAQLIGEALARASNMPVPGPLIGMALLLLFLVVRDRASRLAPRVLAAPLVDGGLESTGKGLLANLSLMFVPAGAGIVATAGSVQGHWLAVIASLVGGTLLTLTVTALVVKALWRDVPPKTD